MKLSALLVFMSCFVGHFAQASGPKIWLENDGGLFSRDYATNGKVKKPIGFFGFLDAEDLVRDNPQALSLAETGSRYNVYTHLVYWLGVLPSAIGFVYSIGTNNPTLSLVFLGTDVVTTFMAVYFMGEARHYMFEAVNTYNGVEKGIKKEAHLWEPKFTLGAAPSGAMLGMQLKF